ncbi:NAD-dependent epimerase/dehydratase family protein [Janibacter melonis]|uniref:NAD-dependent epimerase/dehydratase family protein n=1 Tax=Janibacter melonis TaxID=262209 RepID=A0A5P8FNA6_9MICO|nr:NAD-dependent epimerase/dehydratase family protein [Janibacter melonis]
MRNSTPRRSVRWLWAAVDSLIVVGSVVIAAFLRYDFDADLALATPVLTLTALAVAGQLVLGSIIGPYAVGHERGSYEEIVDVGKTVVAWTLPLGIVGMFVDQRFGPRSLAFTGGALAMLGMFGARFVLRAARTRPDQLTASHKRVLIIGAGDGGRQVVRSLRRDRGAGLMPIGLLDDDSHKRRLRIEGVRVLGTRADLPEVAEQTEATTVAIAIPSADAGMIKDVRDTAAELGLDVMILPRTSELFGRPDANRLRSLDLADLLGRRPIELDRSAIAEHIQGRTVLVTGAGGSIGSELCRQIARFGPSKLLMLDRDESALHATQISVTGKGLLDDDSVVLADIRDEDRLLEVFEQHRPEVVFHAAALKHLPLLEQYPMEAWKTNVLGTLNVLRAAHAVGVRTFVNISTDKAANPSCVLGYSKRVTERLTADYAERDEHTYVSVRFGNVLGSRGSVITAFTAQIEQGGPVTVTHPDVERYFMLIPEACQLVLQAAAIGRDGEVMVLDMGQPAKILDVAETLIEMSGRRDVDIVFTGLRPGEKMSEELFTPGESIRETGHPLVSSVDVPMISADAVARTRHQHPPASADWMRRAAVPVTDSSREGATA